MAHITEHVDLDLDSPILVEGLPGVGLVGKIAANHLVETFEMDHYASCHCDGLPRAATYEEGDRAVRPPVRIYADEDQDLLVLQSDVPVSPESAPEFATCVTGWLAEQGVLPVYLSGLPSEKEDVPEMYGVGVGAAQDRLAEHGVDAPSESGMISGPTGALLAEASEQELEAIGLVVEANAQFPDPEAARVLLVDGIEPFLSTEIETEKLVDQAEEIAEAREKLAQRMQEANQQESSQARPLGMYQ
ncbi:proteasome assembly chaperone family protein [Halovenus sp. WSH3]|uniref:Proteasome assembly chaperone family protein n=1 Tax=Halovenus carboxidivorans TaxID=2692199 RepID=A0A6B0T1U0_9EURY|nr:PAC2 family protein [Halovenus carboxidivorans]MXR52024.1 proteasome assembly chaperone family protein [Halovenus carboxidivorans]